MLRRKEIVFIQNIFLLVFVSFQGKRKNSFQISLHRQTENI